MKNIYQVTAKYRDADLIVKKNAARFQFENDRLILFELCSMSPNKVLYFDTFARIEIHKENKLVFLWDGQQKHVYDL